MAADPTKGDSGDWTAGIAAIAAAVLLGAAVPIGIYFMLYVPQTKEFEHWKRTAEENQIKLLAEEENEKKMRTILKQGDEIKKTMEDLEARFTPVGQGQVLIDEIEGIAKRHKIELPREKRIFTNERIVKPMEADTSLPNKLTANKIVVEGTGTYADFGRFLAELENMQTATLIPGTFVATGDPNAGDKHLFRLELFVIQKRNLDAIGA